MGPSFSFYLSVGVACLFFVVLVLVYVKLVISFCIRLLRYGQYMNFVSHNSNLCNLNQKSKFQNSNKIAFIENKYELSAGKEEI